jgi:hypothetical protein
MIDRTFPSKLLENLNMYQLNKDGAKYRLLSVHVNDLKIKNNAEMKRHFSTHKSVLLGKGSS